MKWALTARARLCAVVISVALFGGTAIGQVVVDKSVAIVNDGVRSELITYSDLLWQLALEPKASLDSPSSEDLNRALQTQINQRLFTLEAEACTARSTHGERADYGDHGAY